MPSFVRWGSPPPLMPLVETGSSLPPPGRFSENPCDAHRALSQLTEPPGKGAGFYYLRPPPERMPPMPELLEIGGRVVQDPDEWVQTVSLPDFPVPLREILWAFAVDLPGYRMEWLSIQRLHAGDLAISGALVTMGEREPAGSFARVIPHPPKGGSPWVADGRGFNSYGEERGKIFPHQMNGFCRLHHQRLLPFLMNLGVDRFNLVAHNQGSFVWAHIGFDFAYREVREMILREFGGWLFGKGKRPSPEKEAEWMRIVHAWELADFAGDQGEQLGRDFLLYRGQTAPGGWEASFLLRPKYEGWRRLFKGYEGSMP